VTGCWPAARRVAHLVALLGLIVALGLVVVLSKVGRTRVHLFCLRLRTDDRLRRSCAKSLLTGCWRSSSGVRCAGDRAGGCDGRQGVDAALDDREERGPKHESPPQEVRHNRCSGCWPSCGGVCRREAEARCARIALRAVRAGNRTAAALLSHAPNQSPQDGDAGHRAGERVPDRAVRGTGAGAAQLRDRPDADDLQLWQARW